MTLAANVREDVALTSNGIPVRNLWYMLCYAWNDQALQQRFKSEVESAPSLDGLLAKLLTSMVARRLRIGLGRNYRNQESTISGIRGRVDFASSLKRMTFQNAKVHCRFQVFDANVLKNQIIRSTLYYVARCGDFGPNHNIAENLKSDIQGIVRQLGGIDLIEVRATTVSRKLLDREDYDYRVMLMLCYLILSRQMPTEVSGQSQSHQIDRDWRFVCGLYEKFVANFFKQHLTEWKTTSQKTLHWPGGDQTDFLPTMRPDVVMQNRLTAHRVVLDTKFTEKCLVKGQFDKWSFSTTHLYQLYAYLRSQEDAWGRVTGVLLYPTVENSLNEATEMHGHTIRWETLDLAQQWVDIERDLLKLAKSFDYRAMNEH
jgi:5-methylcytosine-specific restriction enzyme subunit McrC